MGHPEPRGPCRAETQGMRPSHRGGLPGWCGTTPAPSRDTARTGQRVGPGGPSPAHGLLGSARAPVCGTGQRGYDATCTVTKRPKGTKSQLGEQNPSEATSQLRALQHSLWKVPRHGPPSPRWLLAAWSSAAAQWSPRAPKVQTGPREGDTAALEHRHGADPAWNGPTGPVNPGV